MVLKIKDVKTNGSLIIESNLVETQLCYGACVDAAFDSSNKSLLQHVVQKIFDYINDLPEKEFKYPEPGPNGHYEFMTKWGEVDIVPFGNGMHEIFIDGLSNDDCNLEVYVNDHRIR